MRLCKICNSKMVLQLSKEDSSEFKYYWGCSKFPECQNIEKTILNKNDFSSYHLENENVNSMFFFKPTDIVTDVTRHHSISKHFNHDHKFKTTDIINLDLLMGFETEQDFHFWMATQQIVLYNAKYYDLAVGSPYNFTFKELTDLIDKLRDNAISKIILHKKTEIYESISSWTDFFRRRSAAKNSQVKVSQEKIKEDHDAATKKKADKATNDIYNAIRRKDLNAIESLRRRGADLNFKNMDGITCVEYARTFNDDRLIIALTKDLSEKY